MVSFIGMTNKKNIKVFGNKTEWMAKALLKKKMANNIMLFTKIIKELNDFTYFNIT